MPAPPIKSILIYEHVTGGGAAGRPAPESWVAEAAAMRRALAAEFAAGRPSPRVVVALDPRLPDDPGPRETVRVGSLERLEAAAREVDCTLLIAPETNGDLEGLIRRLGRGGARLLNASAGAVALAADKARLGERLRERGLRTPKFVLLAPGEDPPSVWAPPFALKPVDGAGSIETFFIRGPKSPLPTVGRDRPRLLQEWIGGSPMSATFLVRPGWPPLLLAVGEQRMILKKTEMSYRGGFLPSRIKVDPAPLVAAVAAVDGLAGLVGVDFVQRHDPHESVILEINPRATTSIVGILNLCRPGALAELWALQPPDDPDEWLAAGESIRREVKERGPVFFEPSGRILRLAEMADQAPTEDG